MHRLRAVLGTGVAVAAAAVLLFGIGPNSDLPRSSLLLLVPLGAGLLFRAPRRRVGNDAWATTPATAASYAARPEVPSPRRVALALGRVEARELAASPAFGVGLGFCALVLFLFGWVWPGDSVETWEETLQLAPWFAHPLAGMTVLAAHRAVTRARRDGAAELFDACPADPTARTVGHLLAGVAPVAVLTLFFGLLTLLMAWRSHLVYGPIGWSSAFDVGAAIALGAGAVALGVALGRWVAFPLAPVMAVVVVGFGMIAISEVGGRDWNPLVPLSTAPSIEGPSPLFVSRPTAAHLLWIVALVAVVAVVAVSRDRRDRTLGLVAGGVVALALVAGIATTRPMSTSDATLIADRVAHPEAHQRCETVATVAVCLFDLHRPLLDVFEDHLRAVAESLPPGHAPLTIRQVYEGRLAELPPEVRRHLTAADLRRPAGELPLGDTGDVGIDQGFDVALTAVGLPTRPDAELRPVVVAGQARGVVALWLAARGLEGADAHSVTSSPEPASSSAYDRGSLEVGDCATPAVVWSEQDLRAVRTLLTLPADDVTPVLHGQWERWVDPGTGTDDLLAALGLPPVGPFDAVEALPGNPC